LNAQAWCTLLPPNYKDAEGILQGVEQGFRITDNASNAEVKQVFVPNSFSATIYKNQVESELSEEIKLGNYVVVNKQPTIVSALGAIPKPNSNKIR